MIITKSIFYILTGWTCAINIYKFFYKKKLDSFYKNNNQQNESQLNEMKSHYEKANKLGKVFLTLWCLSAIWFFYSINA